MVVDANDDSHDDDRDQEDHAHYSQRDHQQVLIACNEKARIPLE